MKSLTIFVFILLRNIYALDITEKEFEVYTRGEYNRSFDHSVELSATYAMKLQEFSVKGGLSIGSLSGVTDIKAFSSVHHSPFLRIPLRFSLLYIYNGLLNYNVHTGSILPFVSYNAFRAGVSYGPNFRFTSFFGETAQFDMVNSFSAYYDFINDKKRRLRAIVGNFRDFYAGNFGSYSLKFNYAESLIGSDWTVIGEIELLQSGSDVLSANFYGLALKGGAKYSW